jgi:hypothetical protein
MKTILWLLILILPATIFSDEIIYDAIWYYIYFLVGSMPAIMGENK